MKGKKWLILVIILGIILLSSGVGVTNGSFVDTETSTGNTFTAWVSTLWQQTSQEDFEAGVTINVDTSSNPSDVKLASNSNWYDSNWQYRKSHVVQSAPGAGTDYQVRISVHQGSGTDTGHNVYLSDHCEDDFGDVRFTGSDGTTELDYWLESYTNGNEATFWIRVADDLSSSNATVYVYYGNSGASTTSDGANTFPDLFTDFPGDSLPSGWEVDGDTVGSMVIENSLLKLTAQKEASGSWLKRGVRTTSSVWANDRALMYRIDTINYYPEVTDRRRWFLGGEGGNYYLEFESYGDKIRVRDWNLYDEYSPCDFTGGEVVWLAKESGNDGVAYYYVDGNLIDTLDNGLHPDHAFSNFTVVFNVQVGSNAMPDVDYTYIDWAAIRKFVYPEPTNGGWGDEEGQYISPGSLASQVLDTGIAGTVWDGLFWDETLPASTDITFEVRASDTAFLKEDATPSWISIGGTSPVTSELPSGRYLQWRAILTTTDTSKTPTLQEVRIYYH
jgi:predicted ribosomally synthesized peptide with SipW-like signal peptide